MLDFYLAKAFLSFNDYANRKNRLYDAKIHAEMYVSDCIRLNLLHESEVENFTKYCEVRYSFGVDFKPANSYQWI